MSSDRATAEFLDLAEGWAQDLASSLELLEVEPDRADLVNRVVQTTHNYKNAGSLGYARLAGLAHRMEDVLTLARSGALACSRPVLDALFAGADLMAEMVAAIGRGEGDGAVEASGVIEELGRWLPIPPIAAEGGRLSGATVVDVGEPRTPETAPEPVPEPRLLAAFLEDAEDRSQKLSALVGSLEPGPVAPETINATFRAAHDLKAAAATAGFQSMKRLAHRAENVLDRVRDGALEVTEPVRDALQEAADLIADMVAAIGRGDPEGSVDTSAAVAHLERLVGPAAPGEDSAPPEAARRALSEESFGAYERAQVREAGDRGESLFRLSCDLDPAEPMRFARAYLLFANLEDVVNIVAVDPPMDPSAVEPDAQGAVPDDRAYAHLRVWFTSPRDGSEAMAAAAGAGTTRVERLEAAELLGAIPAPAPAGAAAPGSRTAVERTTIRVDTRKLDTLWTLVAELVQAKAKISTISERLGRGEDGEGLRTGLSEALDSLEKISGGMQQGMMETRTIPIRVIFEKFPRMIRDLSRKLDKAIELEIAGAETEIDRSIVEALSNPLMHLLRNAVDHGIEFPEDRVRTGKSERGTVRVAASQQGGRIVIEVSDDGRGIDPEAVRAKAVAKGIAGAADMDERQLQELLFLPGFSLAPRVSDISGRGVGMDVVAKTIREDLKGEVLLKSQRGAGTQITLLLPLTLTIMRALLVRGEAHVFAVPLSGVETTARVLNTEIRGAGERLSCRWQNGEIPLFTLGGLLGRPGRRGEELSAVVLRRGRGRACLVVEELLEERELVIKPLDDLANPRRLFSGVSLREDGTLVFILDTSFVPEEGS
jgi:two-component system chemotaxis sensor kinase CheA